MNAPTDRQIAVAKKLFATAQFYARRNAARGLAQGKQFDSYVDEMVWLAIPHDRRGVSQYIQLYRDAAVDAVLAVRRGR